MLKFDANTNTPMANEIISKLEIVLAAINAQRNDIIKLEDKEERKSFIQRIAKTNDIELTSDQIDRILDNAHATVEQVIMTHRPSQQSKKSALVTEMIIALLASHWEQGLHLFSLSAAQQLSAAFIPPHLNSTRAKIVLFVLHQIQERALGEYSIRNLITHALRQTILHYGPLGYLAVPFTVAAYRLGPKMVHYVANHPVMLAAHDFCEVMNGYADDEVMARYAASRNKM